MRKKGICVLFALVTVFSTLMAAGQQEAAKVDENGLPIVKMAMCPGLPGMPVMYLAETGLDEKYGFKADTEFYSSGIPMNEALAAGLWDVGTIGAAAVTSLAEYGGVLVTDLTAGLPGMAMLAPVDSKIAHTVGYSPDCPEVFGSADTVRGKTILTVRGAMMHYLALLYLEEIGLTEDDVNLVHMEMGQLRTAFESGQADMASMSPPAATFELLENGFAADCATFQTLNNPQQEVLIANGDFYKEDPELLVKVVAAMIEAQDKLSADYALQGRMAKEILFNKRTECN